MLNQIMHFDLLIENENSDGYNLYIAFTNKAGTYTSTVYTAEVLIKKITTCQDFYNMLSTGTSATTIYQLQNDLDFSILENNQELYFVLNRCF